MNEHTAQRGAGLADIERAVLLAPCECGHTINDHGSLATCWNCDDQGLDPCAHTFEQLLVERVAIIVGARVPPPAETGGSDA